jgi:hypothetical protein
VARIDKALEIVRAAVGVGDGVKEDRVVAPARFAGEGLDRHQLDAVDTRLHQVRNLVRQARQVAVTVDVHRATPAASRTHNS